MLESIIVIAGSGLSREVIETVAGIRHQQVIGCLDDSLSQLSPDFPVPVLGTVDEAVDHLDASFIVCAGQGRTRQSIVARLGELGVGADRFATVVDPSVHLPASCHLSAGSIVLAGCVFTAQVSVGQHVVLMPHVTLTHDVRIDDYATLCAGVTLGGSVRVGAAAYLGMNCSVRQDLVVGAGATLGMGAVAIEEVPPSQIWTGVPARPLERTPA